MPPNLTTGTQTLNQPPLVLVFCGDGGHDQTTDKRQAEAITAALERRRIAKRQAAAKAEQNRKAAISIALNEKRKEKLKVWYIRYCTFKFCAVLNIVPFLVCFFCTKRYILPCRGFTSHAYCTVLFRAHVRCSTWRGENTSCFVSLALVFFGQSLLSPHTMELVPPGYFMTPHSCGFYNFP